MQSPNSVSGIFKVIIIDFAKPNKHSVKLTDGMTVQTSVNNAISVDQAHDAAGV
jgi:hypothetical protein